MYHLDRPCPPGTADLERMPVGILEMNALMPPAAAFQSGSRCGSGGGMLDLALAQPRMYAASMSDDDDRDVLEPAIVAA